MMAGLKEKLMGIPFLYNLVQKIIAGPLHKKIQSIIATEFPDSSDMNILEVGCGLGNYSALFSNAKYTGVDLDPAYINSAQAKFGASNRKFTVGDATLLSFNSSQFNGIFSVGLYHHIDDKGTVDSLKSLKRFTTDSGRILVFDAVYPDAKKNYLGYYLRKNDRGRFVRTRDQYVTLLEQNLTVRRYDFFTAGFLDVIFFEL